MDGMTISYDRNCESSWMRCCQKGFDIHCVKEGWLIGLDSELILKRAFSLFDKDKPA